MWFQVFYHESLPRLFLLPHGSGAGTQLRWLRRVWGAGARTDAFCHLNLLSFCFYWGFLSLRCFSVCWGSRCRVKTRREAEQRLPVRREGHKVFTGSVEGSESIYSMFHFVTHVFRLWCFLLRVLRTLVSVLVTALTVALCTRVRGMEETKYYEIYI